MTTTDLICASCGARSREGDKFCHGCGASVAGKSATPAEYKQPHFRLGDAGEIGWGALGYAAVGEQVGVAQRMEFVALPGGICSLSIARLIEDAALQGEPQMVRIK